MKNYGAFGQGAEGVPVVLLKIYEKIVR